MHFSILNQKIVQLTKNDKVYPKRLIEVMGLKAPDQLYLVGNLDLLVQDGVGFCGSRKASEKGLETAKDCAEQAAKKGIVVISGNAAGVDFETHVACLQSGGKTILVLPEGINQFRIKRGFESVWNWNNVLIISQFDPDDTWQAFRAMARNQVIIGLSKAMIVIEAGEKGGTLNAGLETLKKQVPLFVAEYQNMNVSAKGNKILIDRGAQRLSKSRTTNRANMAKVFDSMTVASFVSETAQQLLL